MVTDGCCWGGITGTSGTMDIDTMDTSDTVDDGTFTKEILYSRVRTGLVSKILLRIFSSRTFMAS